MNADFTILPNSAYDPGMSTTSDKTAESIQAVIYRRMTPAQKWEEVCRMREATWQLKAAGLRAQHPTWSEQGIELQVRKIFLYASTSFSERIHCSAGKK